MFQYIYIFLSLYGIFNKNWQPGWDFATTLLFSNSSINPFLYCWRLCELRTPVVKTARQMLCKQTEENYRAVAFGKKRNIYSYFCSFPLCYLIYSLFYCQISTLWTTVNKQRTCGHRSRCTEIFLSVFHKWGIFQKTPHVHWTRLLVLFPLPLEIVCKKF